jgi:hypothetical protein
MTITFWKQGEEDEPHQIETEEVTVKVTSLLPEDIEGLTIHDVTGPVDLPRPARQWALGAGVGALLVAAVAGGIVLWRRRRGPSVPGVRVPPHEIAFDALRKLVAEDLTGKGQIKLFYQRLSEILRRYIEGRFGLHAPEQTTEEFLEGLRGNERLNREYRSLLEGFLRHCDLVKFAEHRPEAEDIQNTFDSCKTFIMETQEVEQGNQGPGVKASAGASG